MVTVPPSPMAPLATPCAACGVLYGGGSLLGGETGIPNDIPGTSMTANHALWGLAFDWDSVQRVPPSKSGYPHWGGGTKLYISYIRPDPQILAQCRPPAPTTPDKPLGCVMACEADRARGTLCGPLLGLSAGTVSGLNARDGGRAAAGGVRGRGGIGAVAVEAWEWWQGVGEGEG